MQDGINPVRDELDESFSLGGLIFGVESFAAAGTTVSLIGDDTGATALAAFDFGGVSAGIFILGASFAFFSGFGGSSPVPEEDRFKPMGGFFSVAASLFASLEEEAEGSAGFFGSLLPSFSSFGASFALGVCIIFSMLFMILVDFSPPPDASSSNAFVNAIIWSFIATKAAADCKSFLALSAVPSLLLSLPWCSRNLLWEQNSVRKNPGNTVHDDCDPKCLPVKHGATDWKASVWSAATKAGKIIKHEKIILIGDGVGRKEVILFGHVAGVMI